jgi:hypothetical protein
MRSTPWLGERWRLQSFGDGGVYTGVWGGGGEGGQMPATISTDDALDAMNAGAINTRTPVDTYRVHAGSGGRGRGAGGGRGGRVGLIWGWERAWTI